MRNNHRDIFFSIIMPTYNRRQRIGCAIDSFMAQTYDNAELIIVDDGSRDGTEQYVTKTYAAAIARGAIRYHVLPENHGAAHARNEGLAMARGSWIGYLDSDNTMRQNFLRTFHRHIIAHPAYRIFYAKVMLRQAQSVVGEMFDREKIYFINFIDLGAFVHAADVVKTSGGFDVSLSRMIDWDFILKCSEKEVPFFIDRVLVDYYDGTAFSRISTSENVERNYKMVVMNCIRRMSDMEFKERRNTMFQEKRRLQKELQEVSAEMRQLRQELRRKNEELSVMQSSKFWRLRNACIAVKTKLFIK